MRFGLQVRPVLDQNRGDGALVGIGCLVQWRRAAIDSIRDVWSNQTSTIEACVSTAVAAGVRELHVGHRDPARNDEAVSRLEVLLRERLREELRRAGRAEDSCRARIVHEGLTVRC